MTHSTDNAWNHPEAQLASGRYIVAYIVGLALMGLSFGLVEKHAFTPLGLGIAISAIGALAAIVQCVLLLHMNLSETQIWHTVALVLFIPLFVLAIGLTAWMFHGLYRRTMMMPVPHASSTAPTVAKSGA